METQHYPKSNSRILGGLFLLGIGIVLFLRQTGVPMPFWLFRWPMILIVIGIFSGIRNNFRGAGWVIPIIIGGVFLVDSLNPLYSLRKFTAPFIIIAIGLVMILRPRRNRNRVDNYNYNSFEERSGFYKTETYPAPATLPVEQAEQKDAYYSGEDYIDSVSVFGSVSKVVVSKNFKGGDMVAILGGSQLDLRQADITGKIVLDVTVFMGGAKLILPSNWEVKSEMTAVFGGVEDKRQLPAITNNPDKILLLKGTSIFGGIEIRNF